MKTLISKSGILAATTLSLALAGVAAAQPVFQPEGDGADSSVANLGPRCTFEIMSHDFGTIPDTEPVTFHFKFANTGTGLLMIDHVKSSCHCTAGEVKIHDYLPGESGSIDVTYDPTTRKGPQAREVTVYTNDPVNPTLVLKISAVVKPIVETDPAIINFGDIIAGTQGKQTFRVRSAKPNFQISELKLESPDRMKATIGAAVEVTDADGSKVTEYPVELEILNTKTIGPVAQTVTIVTNIPSVDAKSDYYSIAFAAAGTIVADVQARPNRVALGALQPGDEFSREFQLTSRTSKAFKVLGVEVKPLKPIDMTAEAVTEVGADGLPVIKVVVKGIAPEELGQLRGTIVVTTDNPDSPTIEIPMNGLVRKLVTPPATTQPQGQPQPATKPGGGGQ